MRPLRASDLQPGLLYYAPSGRMCKLLPLNEAGHRAGFFTFAPLSQYGVPDEAEAWTIPADAERTIAAIRPAVWGMALKVAPAVAPLLRAAA